MNLLIFLLLMMVYKLIPFLIMFVIISFLFSMVFNTISNNKKPQDFNSFFNKFTENIRRNTQQNFRHNFKQSFYNSQRQDSMFGNMSHEEARKILGVGPNATQAEIKTNYHNLIRKMHPDCGGSQYLAAKINEAKKTLIGR